MDNIILASLSQLAVQIPHLVVYLIGFILALVFWKRCPMACMFTLIAVILLIMISVTQPFLVQYIIHARIVNEEPISVMSTKLMIVGITYSILQALSMALLISAVFLKRKVPT